MKNIVILGLFLFSCILSFNLNAEVKTSYCNDITIIEELRTQILDTYKNSNGIEFKEVLKEQVIIEDFYAYNCLVSFIIHYPNGTPIIKTISFVVLNFENKSQQLEFFKELEKLKVPKINVKY